MAKVNNMATVTPGPWEVHEGEDYIAVVGKGQWTDNALARVDTVANARLIAAAPDLARENAELREQVAQLLQALKGLVDVACHTQQCGRGSSDGNDYLGCACEVARHKEVARQAIAAAEPKAEIRK